MSDEDALLSAIAAHPDKDTPRLAYADWLDEHGRHDRAEFIRAQIEVARVETLPRVLLNRHVDVFRRQQELIDHHRDELLGPLAGLPKDVKIEFRRGFVSELTFRADRFLSHADDVALLRPTPDVRLWDVAANLNGLSSISDHMAIVSAIEMQSPHRAFPTPLTADWDIETAAWPWDRLREMNLEGCQVGDEGLRRLIVSESLSRVSDLDLSGNDLTHAGVTALLDSVLPRQLRRLILGGNPLTNAAAIELAERWPTGADDKLEYLNLRFTGIGQPGQQALLRRFGGRIDLF
jgi:uncharacterized protein (TIGR02996 family)